MPRVNGHEHSSTRVHDQRGDTIATVGHIAAGIGIASGAGYLRDWLVLVTLTVAALIPDIDFLLGIQHRGWTHTIGFAAVFGVVAAGLMWKSHRPRPVLIGTLAFAAVASHLVLDIITAPDPLPALWPLTRREFALEDSILPAAPPMDRLLTAGGLLETAAEIVWSTVLVVAAVLVDGRWRTWRAKRVRDNRTAGPTPVPD